MIIDKRQLSDAEAIRFHVEHRNQDEFNPIYWLPDDELKAQTLASQADPDAVAGIAPDLRRYPQEPLASHPNDSDTPIFDTWMKLRSGSPVSYEEAGNYERTIQSNRQFWSAFGSRARRAVRLRRIKTALAIGLWVILAVIVSYAALGVNVMEWL
jgi:hypothetical protein